MLYNTLLTHEADGILTITLHRPERRNALTPEMQQELIIALESASDSAVEVVILTGAGTAFCAGLDLTALQAMTTNSAAEQEADARRIARLFRTLYTMPMPTIAAVNGHAVAGGTGLATLCDFTLAVPEAKFGYTEVRIGFVPAIVSTFLLRQVGEKVARDLLLTGRLFDTAEGQRIGLINEIVPPEKLLGRARELAAQLAENSPLSLSNTKRLLTDHARAELDAQIEAAIHENAGIRESDDFREGIESFLEKRK